MGWLAGSGMLSGSFVQNGLSRPLHHEFVCMEIAKRSSENHESVNLVSTGANSCTRGLTAKKKKAIPWKRMQIYSSLPPPHHPAIQETFHKVTLESIVPFPHDSSFHSTPFELFLSFTIENLHQEQKKVRIILKSSFYAKKLSQAERAKRAPTVWLEYFHPPFPHHPFRSEPEACAWRGEEEEEEVHTEFHQHHYGSHRGAIQNWIPFRPSFCGKIRRKKWNSPVSVPISKKFSSERKFFKSFSEQKPFKNSCLNSKSRNFQISSLFFNGKNFIFFCEPFFCLKRSSSLLLPDAKSL